MRPVAVVFGSLALSLAIFFLHLFVLLIPPYPLNQLNVVLISLMWLAFYTDQKIVIWLSLLLGLLMELFSALPFGIYLIVIIITIAALRFGLKRIFTNRSIYIIAITGFSALCFYRALFIALELVAEIFSAYQSHFSPATFVTYGVEIVVTGLAQLAIYFISARFIRRLNPRYIE